MATEQIHDLDCWISAALCRGGWKIEPCCLGCPRACINLDDLYHLAFGAASMATLLEHYFHHIIVKGAQQIVFTHPNVFLLFVIVLGPRSVMLNKADCHCVSRILPGACRRVGNAWI